MSSAESPPVVYSVSSGPSELIMLTDWCLRTLVLLAVLAPVPLVRSMVARLASVALFSNSCSMSLLSFGLGATDVRRVFLLCIGMPDNDS